ncbi:MAG: hypothetical protein ACYTJ0_04720 [Planctomycetota bacterium]|jgi:hypothetical protein
MMNRRLFVGCITLVLSCALVATAYPPPGNGCTTIQDGVLQYSAGSYLDGEALPTGEGHYGYNYQARKFAGSYFDAYANRDGFPPYDGDDEAYLAEYPDAESHWAWDYRDIQLAMKWNDAWLSNKDCDEDGLLDRHYGFDEYVGSGAWLTNYMWGVYETGEHWFYFVKIVAGPADGYKENGFWYTADGDEIGPEIWGAFAQIMWVSNDPVWEEHGVQYVSPHSAGFGAYAP